MKQVLFITEPHGAQEVRLIDDDPKPGNCIIEIVEVNFCETTIANMPRISLTGEELDSICEWWQKYKLTPTEG